MSKFTEISEAVQNGKRKIVVQLINEAIEEGLSPKDILEQGLLAGIDIVGNKFKNGNVFIPEILVSAKAMSAGTEILKPLLAGESGISVGKACIGTVKGDLHDIGKNLVKMMLEGKGFEVIDLGVDVDAQQFVNCVKEHGCRIVCCSALLTTTMPAIGDVVRAFEEAGLRHEVKIMVGGAPVTQAFCDQIGADAYTHEAASAAEKALELVKSFAER